jgi:hypothetical protein
MPRLVTNSDRIESGTSTAASEAETPSMSKGPTLWLNSAMSCAGRTASPEGDSVATPGSGASTDSAPYSHANTAAAAAAAASGTASQCSLTSSAASDSLALSLGTASASVFTGLRDSWDAAAATTAKLARANAQWSIPGSLAGGSGDAGFKDLEKEAEKLREARRVAAEELAEAKKRAAEMLEANRLAEMQLREARKRENERVLEEKRKQEEWRMEEEKRKHEDWVREEETRAKREEAQQLLEHLRVEREAMDAMERERSNRNSPLAGQEPISQPDSGLSLEKAPSDSESRDVEARKLEEEYAALAGTARAVDARRGDEDASLHRDGRQGAVHRNPDTALISAMERMSTLSGHQQEMLFLAGHAQIIQSNATWAQQTAYQQTRHGHGQMGCQVQNNETSDSGGSYLSTGEAQSPDTQNVGPNARDAQTRALFPNKQATGGIDAGKPYQSDEIQRDLEFRLRAEREKAEARSQEQEFLEQERQRRKREEEDKERDAKIRREEEDKRWRLAQKAREEDEKRREDALLAQLWAQREEATLVCARVFLYMIMCVHVGMLEDLEITALYTCFERKITRIRHRKCGE